MNIIPGKIQDLHAEGQLSLIKISIDNEVFTSIVIDTPSTAPYLTIGTSINMLFKENEVVIAKNLSGGISMQNKFSCAVKALNKGSLLSEIILDYKGYTIVSLITTNATNQLQLAIGDQVQALVKTNEISLSPHD